MRYRDIQGIPDYKKKHENTWHADAAKPANLIKTTSIVETWRRETFVDLQFTTRSIITEWTVTAKRAWCIDACSTLFTRLA
jgi:hypothetical protein